MKWKDFKGYVEENGVSDDTEVVWEDANFGGNDGEIRPLDLIIDTENNELRIGPKFYGPVD